ncbi:hypothetical protein BJY00DRAFT_286525 [Aspergillus carlsbadensis]|nr:hypothetical protein BJY00DRAFT_286525 [Aspergillus carlsbadensis]
MHICRTSPLSLKRCQDTILANTVYFISDNILMLCPPLVTLLGVCYAQIPPVVFRKYM